MTDEASAEALYREGVAAFRRGDNAECRRLSAQALVAAREIGSQRVQALAHVGLSRASFREAEYDEGLEHARIAEELAHECGAAGEQMMALHMRAEITRAQRRYDDAVPLYRELLQIDEAAGDDASLAMEQYNLGSVLLQAGALDDAELHLNASLDRCDHDDDQLPYTLLGLAGLHARRGDVALAGRAIAGVEAHFAAAGEVLDPAEALELASHVAAGRRRDSAAFEAGRAEPVTPETARALMSRR